VEEDIVSGKQRGIRGLRVASILSWFWGILLLISSVALGIPMVSRGSPLVFPLLLVVLGILFCVAGNGVRKQRQYSRWLAVACSIASSVLLLLLRVSISPVGLVICLVITILVVINWKVFH